MYRFKLTARICCRTQRYLIASRHLQIDGRSQFSGVSSGSLLHHYGHSTAASIEAHAEFYIPVG